MQAYRFPGIRIFLATLTAICWGTSNAHDFWIEPADFRPLTNVPLSITLRVGEDFSGTSQPLIPDWFTDYSIYRNGERSLVDGIIGDDPAGSFVIQPGGTQIIGYRSSRAFVELEPAKFDEYLRAEGMEWVIRARQERGESESNAREYYSRCAKALILPDGETAGTGHDIALGYTLELIPEKNPYSLATGDRLPLRLLYEGEPIKDILVVAFSADEPEQKSSQRTDAEGRVQVLLDRPGSWLVKAVHIIEVPAENPMAEWESFWASLTFAIDG